MYRRLIEAQKKGRNREKNVKKIEEIQLVDAHEKDENVKHVKSQKLPVTLSAALLPQHAIIPNKESYSTEGKTLSQLGSEVAFAKKKQTMLIQNEDQEEVSVCKLL